MMALRPVQRALSPHRASVVLNHSRDILLSSVVLMHCSTLDTVLMSIQYFEAARSSRGYDTVSIRCGDEGVK
jgi:hypothetical protein